SRISGAVGSSRLWAVPWRSLCRLRLQPACWAGTVGALSVHRRGGDGCKRRGNKRWSHSNSTLMGPPQGTRLRPTGGQPTGKTRWHEVQVGVLARLGQHRTRTGKVLTRLRQRRLVAVLGDIEALKPRLWLEAVRQGLSTAPQVVWLSDGARGLWRLYEEQLAAVAVGILDFYHAVQYLWKGAAAWLDGRTTRARRWFGWARHRLRHGQPDGVLADLVEALAVEGLPDSARDTLTALYAYLERHRAHID